MMMSRFCILFPLLEYAQFCAGNHIIFKGIFMTTSQSSSHPSTHPPTYLAPAPTAFPLALSTWSPAWSDGTPAAATKYISKCTFADKWKENPFYSLSLFTAVEKCNFKTPLLGILCTILHIEGAITRAVKCLIYIILRKELNLVYLSTLYRVSVDI